MLKQKLTVLIGLLVVAIFLAYMFSFQVRYDQKAILTTFDKATPNAVKGPGLHPKWPWPRRSWGASHGLPTMGGHAVNGCTFQGRLVLRLRNIV